MNIVWFKRDLRIYDHEALVRASQLGPILPLYILEPELWKQPDMSKRHYMFLTECLQELDEDLKKLGHSIVIKVGEAKSVLKKLIENYEVRSVWSHQETWNGWTYKRDIEVKKLLENHIIPWHEPRQNGVIRRLKSRNGWAAAWHKTMTTPILKLPIILQTIKEPSDDLPSAHDLKLQDDGCIMPQKGGRHAGLKALKSFFLERGEHYTKEMSSPVSAYKSCSRLSPYLAFGTLSMREVFQASERRMAQIQAMPPYIRGKWPNAIKSFTARLRWHCHFIQKLEDEPSLEFDNMHSAYNGFYQEVSNEDYFNAWKNGNTGYPMVDACMRALIATGWINFRMRAMLMSFSSHHLGLHWRKPALHLARLFTDYEPGIHYAQAQMQSGTTGINSIRIYNPIKQGIEHDPKGLFIRKWIPELRDMPDGHIHTPWKSPSKMNGYPMPIVDEKVARLSAADRLYSLRRNNTHFKEEADKILHKHGSRKKTSKAKISQQTELPLWLPK